MLQRCHRTVPWWTSRHAVARFSTAASTAKRKAYALEAEAHPDEEASYIGKTGGEIFHDMMRKHNVRHVFGYPGGAILPVFDAIYGSKDFDFFLPRHEQGAGHMAEGYARATGKPGVVIVTSGPGATNVITPMQDALCDGTPMVVFSGQVPTTAIGTDAFQEADIIGISRFCTKWNVMVKDIHELPQRIDEAFKIATSGRPGPVLVDLPKDVTAGVFRAPRLRRSSLPRFVRKSSSSDDENGAFASVDSATQAAIKQVAALIHVAKRPIIYAGQGVVQSGAWRELRELSRLADLPVTTTLQALGAFDEHSPRSLHMLGMHGSVYANYAMQEADLILALGARFDDRVTGNLAKFAPAARLAAAQGKGGIVHFDILAKNINKVVHADTAVLGDVGHNLRLLLPLLQAPSPDLRREWHQQLAAWKAQHPFQYAPCAPGDPLKPQAVIEELDRQTKDIKGDVIVTTGVGQHQMWAAQYYRWTHPRSFITSGGLGTMGYGLPSAIGAKVARPDKIVVDIDGDASFSMTAMELVTAAQYNIGVKVLLLNNDFQGMVRQWQDLFYQNRYSGTEMCNPDFVLLAESMGVRGLRARTPEELRTAMKAFLEHDGPVLLDAVVDKREHVYPMVPGGKGLHEMVTMAPSS